GGVLAGVGDFLNGMMIMMVLGGGFVEEGGGGYFVVGIDWIRGWIAGMMGIRLLGVGGGGRIGRRWW
ncbi:hypothetical protein, partial [Paenibacillus xylanexedens]|uniref:hypothetical protein n=1 Tax=Paenibacillus xylanexedens TaxID=528191 RepID=UPI001C930C82